MKVIPYSHTYRTIFDKLENYWMFTKSQNELEYGANAFKNNTFQKLTYGHPEFLLRRPPAGEAG